MINTIILIVLVLLIIKFIKNSKNRSILSGVIIIVFLLYVIFVVIGINFRFSSIAAARANSFVNSDDEWITNVKLDENEVHLFYDAENDIYRAVYVQKMTLGYRSNFSSFSHPHYGDKMQLLGNVNVIEDRLKYSAFFIKSIDDEVTSISLVNANGNILKSTEIKIDEIVSMTYIYKNNEISNDCTLIAYDKELKPKYYLGYKKGVTVFKDEEYKWYEYE